MREICTSGSVRGGGDNVPTYSAFDRAQRVETYGEGGGLGQVASVPEKCNSPATNAACNCARNRVRNRRERTRTGRKNPGLQATHRVWSGERPPPGTMQ